MSAAIRVIFVDDEPRVLEGLKRMLRPKRNEWQMTFVGSAAEALNALKKEPCEVVVTDMRMPRLDGLSLLRKIRPLAVDFVDAFGVPPEMLRSPDLIGT